MKIDSDEVTITAEDAAPNKKLVMESLETKSEITITPIPKTIDEKSNGNAGTVA